MKTKVITGITLTLFLAILLSITFYSIQTVAEPTGIANSLASDLAAAMGVDSADIISATFSVDEIAGAVVYGNVGFLAPTDGDTFVILSTGNAKPAPFDPAAGPYQGGWIGTPDKFLSVINKNPNGTCPLGGKAYNIATLNLMLRAPDWAKSLSFDFRFMSEEYPRFVDDKFNDFFSCLLDGTNIVFDAEGKIVNVNNNFFDPTITPEGTVFDGTTVLLTAKAPIMGGTTFELDFIVSDVSDGVFDTAVFLDNFHFSTEEVDYANRDTDGDGIPDIIDTDDDNDGIPDVWEKDNKLDPLDAQDASSDPDNDGLQNIQEYLENKNPNVDDAEVIRDPRSMHVVAEVAVVGASVTAVTAVLASFGSLGQSFDSAVSKLPIPDKLKGFLKLYGKKIFEKADKAELEALEKAPFITRGELVALGISILIITMVLGFVETNGLPRFLNPSVLAVVIPSTLLAACMGIIAKEFSEVLCARSCKIYRQFRLWMYGIVAFLISGILFLFPFGYPGIAKYQSGEISNKTKGLFSLSKMLVRMTLMVPFAGLFMLGFKIVGDAGLLMTLTTVCYSFVPLQPLEGKAVFDYRKEVSLIALVSAGILLYSFTFNLLPHVTYLAVGVVSVFLATITLYQLRKSVSEIRDTHANTFKKNERGGDRRK